MTRSSTYSAAVVVVFVVAVLGSKARADLIDFESGFVDLQAVGVVATASNTVTFAVGPNGGSPSGTGFIAGVGAPTTSFVPVDTPAAASAGAFFLTDEIAGPVAALDYFISFQSPVLNLEMDLFDYRVDGGPSIGDTATLNVYADAARTILVGSASFTIPSPNPVDGNVEHLAILAPASTILSAHLTFSGTDVGTGIDNIQFTTIPEPASMILFGLGVAGVSLARRRRRRA